MAVILGIWASAKVYISNLWSTGTALPVARAGIATAVYGTDIYLLNGQANTGTSSTSQEHRKYSTITNSYTTLSTPPTYGGHNWGETIGAYIYYTFGAVNQNQTIYRYDPSANTWTLRSSSTYVGNRSTTVSLGVNVYIFGANQGGFYSSSSWAYNTSTNTVTTLATGSSTSSPSVGMAYNSKAVIVVSNGASEYDPSTNTFTTLATSSSHRTHSFGGGDGVGGLIVAGGGSGSAGNDPYSFVNTAYRYNRVSNTWSAALATMPAATAYGGGGEVVGSRLYCIGGYQTVSGSKTLVSTNYIYNI